MTKKSIYRVSVRGFILVPKPKWYDKTKPEYWGGTLEIAETRNIKAARRLFRMVKLEVLGPRYKAYSVDLLRYRTIIASRPPRPKDYWEDATPVQDLNNPHRVP